MDNPTFYDAGLRLQNPDAWAGTCKAVTSSRSVQEREVYVEVCQTQTRNLNPYTRPGEIVWGLNQTPRVLSP